MPTDEKGGTISSKYYAGMAAGVNSCLNCHPDKDFCTSAVTVHTRETYTENHKVVAYFCFPLIGLAVPLRPGDTLFFNPREYHCISSRCDNKDDIYCVSLYLKSACVGLNNNLLKREIVQISNSPGNNQGYELQKIDIEESYSL